MRARLLIPLVLLLACSDYGFTPDGVYDKGGEEPEEEPVADDPPQDTAAPADTAEPADTGDWTPDTDPPEDTDEPYVPGEPEAGCSDGQREGYLDWDAYPDIAACAGAWDVAGITRSDLAPTCSRGSGDDSWNTEGSGCSAADLCAEGWHVCEGADEVAEKAGSCDDAVPEGAPNKSLFFAVQQHSYSNSVCDDGAAEGNDVFGCGNLGTDLSTDKNCGVLNKVLASMNPGTCGYNEAEPSHGPWECDGGDDSHYHEGELVTKKGCPGGSCSYDGYGVGNSDKGGVVCCRD